MDVDSVFEFKVDFMISSRNGSRQIALQRLANSAHALNMEVLRGKLVKSAETGRWQIGSHDLLNWLEAHAGEDVMTVLGEVDEGGSTEYPYNTEPRSCRKCGRDYIDSECPHCRHSRYRIRGRY